MDRISYELQWTRISIAEVSRRLRLNCPDWLRLDGLQSPDMQ